MESATQDFSKIPKQWLCSEGPGVPFTLRDPGTPGPQGREAAYPGTPNLNSEPVACASCRLSATTHTKKNCVNHIFFSQSNQFNHASWWPETTKTSCLPLACMAIKHCTSLQPNEDLLFESWCDVEALFALARGWEDAKLAYSHS